MCTGLDHAKSSLTVPLRLHDKVIGVFNIEARSERRSMKDDRQFAEIFGPLVAIALNILDLMVIETYGLGPQGRR
jgi:GAF domain-containing protein